MMVFVSQFQRTAERAKKAPLLTTRAVQTLGVKKKRELAIRGMPCPRGCTDGAIDSDSVVTRTMSKL